MKKRLLILALMPVLFISCNKKENKVNPTNSFRYTYMEVFNIDYKIDSANNSEVIVASNDSSAFRESYIKFCTSLKTSKRKPIGFKLFDERGNDLSNGYFLSSVYKEKKDIESFVLGDSVPISKYLVDENSKNDSVKIRRLSKLFRKTKDEFSSDNKIWYYPKGSPVYVNRNALYCYFQVVDGVASNLRLKFQYEGEDWLFFHTLQFSIDGKSFEYSPSKTETDCGNGGQVWEWSDDALSAFEKDLITALCSAKSAKMKIIGKQYYSIKKISKEQISGFKNTIDLYNALGGNY